jgi:hypothetical protein
MTDVADRDRIVIEGACRDLVNRYAALVDDGRADEVPDLFTEDGLWATPGLEMRGRAELAEGFGRRARRGERVSRHVCTNFHLSEVSDDEATGSVYLTLYRYDRADDAADPAPETRPALVGVYRDRFVRAGTRWLIAERRLQVDFQQAGS